MYHGYITQLERNVFRVFFRSKNCAIDATEMHNDLVYDRHKPYGSTAYPFTFI